MRCPRDSYFSSTRGPTGYAGVATFCRRGVTSVVHAEEGFTGTYVDAGGAQRRHAMHLEQLQEANDWRCRLQA